MAKKKAKRVVRRVKNEDLLSSPFAIILFGAFIILSVILVFGV